MDDIDFDFDFPNSLNFHNDHFGTNKVSDQIYRAMKKDQIIQSDEENKIELSGKGLKINGEKQPTNIWKKYKNLYEYATGTTLSKDSRIDMNFEKSKKQLRRSRNL